MTMQAHIRQMQSATRTGGPVRSTTNHPSVERHDDRDERPSYSNQTDYRALYLQQLERNRALTASSSTAATENLPTTQDGLNTERTNVVNRLDASIEKVLRETQYGAGDSNGLSRAQVITEFQTRNGLPPTGTLDATDAATREAVLRVGEAALAGRRDELLNKHPDSQRMTYLDERIRTGNSAMDELRNSAKRLGAIDERLKEPSLSSEQRELYSSAMSVIGGTGQFETLRDEKLTAIRNQNLGSYTAEKRNGLVDQEVLTEFGNRLLNGQTVNGIAANQITAGLNMDGLRSAVENKTMNEDLMHAVENYSLAMASRRGETHSALMGRLSAQDRKRGLNPDPTFDSNITVLTNNREAFLNAAYKAMGKERPVPTAVTYDASVENNNYMP
ncbi:MAG: hypothetical protein IT290_05180 [Deltaproteobacteria bacterium]|nr:hypothetical protein [Deltaproteobacteria bacterium]